MSVAVAPPRSSSQHRMAPAVPSGITDPRRWSPTAVQMAMPFGPHNGTPVVLNRCP